MMEMETEMEEERRNKHGKKKIQLLPLKSLTIGGEGGITGLLVFGGALAVAGFMAVTSFVTNKNNKAKRIHHHHRPIRPQQQFNLLGHDDRIKHKSGQEEESSWTSHESVNQEEKKIDNKPDSYAEEENPTCVNHHQTAFSHPQSASASSNRKVFVEEKDEPRDGLTSTEEETEEEEEDINSDDVMEETDEEDRSKAIGTTVLDYNEEPVWVTVPKEEATLNQKANFSVVSNEQPSILTTWVMPILFFALLSLLVLLTHGLREYLYALDDGDSVIVP